MAERFNLTAQIQLQAPTNTAQVVGQIKQQLKGINVNVNVKSNVQQVAKLNKQLQGVSKAGDASAKSIGRMNTTLAQAARRFGVITVATGSFLALARAVKNATGEAIAFERELIKISQVTGKSVARLQGLTKEVTRLSTSLGVSSSELLNVSRTLSQAGFSAIKTKQALETLAKTTLAATFDNIKDTTEGAIAVLRQFSDESKRAGGDIKFLASTMDAINSVSKRFAVESGDLITVIRRVGGVFSAAGGKVNELIALFTSVRATTRESAETIATGLRTIFTRIQRTDTVDQLKALGIQLRDSKGQFVGAYEAVRRLSVGLSTLDPRDFRFSDIVESLGGFRQVGKVIPLIQQFATAQNALAVAQSSSGSVARDAAKAQLGLGVEITKVKEEFAALLRQFADSSTFRSIAGGALQLASAFIKIASALEKVLPLITAMIGMKIGQALAPGLGALMGGVGLRRRNQGGKIHGFAGGGHVPGTGSRDTVPAMLTPGEFVIKKSSANKLGASTLEAMNNNRYASGGAVQLSKRSRTMQKLVYTGARNISKDSGVDFDPSKNQFTEGDTFTGDIKNTKIRPQKSVVDRMLEADKAALLNSSNTIAQGKAFEKYLIASKRMIVPTGFGATHPLDGKRGSELIEVKRTSAADSVLLDKNIRHQIRTGNRLKSTRLSGKADNIKLPSLTELELDKNALAALADKKAKGVKAQKKAKGGGISGSDTVPALLTPGEFVVNKSSAQNIGYNNLEMMNKTGVKRFAAGGAVGMAVQRFAGGGRPTGKDLGLSASFTGGFADIIGDMADVEAAFQKIGVSGKNLTDAMLNVESSFEKGISPAQSFDKAFEEMKKGIDETKKAAAEADAALAKDKKRAGAGDIVAADVKKFGGGIGTGDGVSVKGLVAGAKEDDSIRDELKRIQKSEIASIQKKIRATEKDVSASNAMKRATSVVQDKYGVLAKDLEANAKAQKAAAKAGRGAARRQAVGAGARAGGQVGGGGGAVAGGVAGLDKMAQAAQQFAFLGAMAASVGAQFTGLEETTQAAISATSASVASIVGIGGTLLQVFTAMAAAGTTAAAADMEEAGASTLAAASGGGVAQGLGLIAIGLTAAYAAAEFFRQKLIAESAALGKAIEETIKKLEEGTGTGEGLAQQQIDRTQKGVAGNEAGKWMSYVKPVLAALTGMLIGFAVAGKIAASIATLLTAGITLLTGGLLVLTAPVGLVVAGIVLLGGLLAGWAGWLWSTNDATKEGIRVAELEAAAIKETTGARVASIESLRSLNEAITDLGERNFVDTAAGRSEKIQATGDVVSQGLSSIGGGAEANTKLVALAKKAEKSTGELTAADFEGDNVRFKTQFEDLISILETNSEGLKNSLKLAQSNFTAAVKEDVTGELGFEELRAKNGNFAKTLDQLKQATEASIEAERQRIQALLDSTQEDREATNAAKAQMQDLEDKREKILGEQIKYAKDVAAAAQERYAADLQAAQATQELSRRMDAISKFTKNVELLGQAAKDAANAMDLRIAAFSDGDIQVKIPEISGLADPTNVADPARFNQQIDSLIADLPRAMQSGADQQADTIRQASDLFGGFRSSVRGRGVGLDESVPEEAERILAASGLNLPRGGQLEKQVLADLVEALREPGGLSDEKFNKIFSFVKEEADEAAKNLGELNKTRQVEIDTHKKYITALDAQRQRENSARQRLIQTQIKGEKIRAKARGGSFDINRIEASRRAQAQAGLRGTGLRAGDAEGAFAAILDARLKRQDIANRLSGVDLGTDEYKQLASEQLKYNNIIKAAQGELKRLGDQSGRVADLQAKIAEEAKGRKQFAALGTSFAFGSDKGRQDIGQGLANTRLAIQNGFLRRGLAGATEDQRASVGSILDQLSDFKFRGVKGKDKDGNVVDLTGRQIKAELAAQEVLRLTGDRAMAAAQRLEVLKGSKEEQLINSLDKLTRVMERAADLSLGAEEAMGSARGGMVYRADGGSIFQPKGTDTVPAMLTPGEFVIKKSSVDRIGAGNLQALNDGVQYRQGGGGVQYLKKAGEVEKEEAYGWVGEVIGKPTKQIAEGLGAPVDRTRGQKFPSTHVGHGTEDYVKDGGSGSILDTVFGETSRRTVDSAINYGGYMGGMPDTDYSRGVQPMVIPGTEDWFGGAGFSNPLYGFSALGGIMGGALQDAMSWRKRDAAEATKGAWNVKTDEAGNAIREFGIDHEIMPNPNYDPTKPANDDNSRNIKNPKYISPEDRIKNQRIVDAITPTTRKRDAEIAAKSRPKNTIIYDQSLKDKAAAYVKEDKKIDPNAPDVSPLEAARRMRNQRDKEEKAAREKVKDGADPEALNKLKQGRLDAMNERAAAAAPMSYQERKEAESKRKADREAAAAKHQEKMAQTQAETDAINKRLRKSRKSSKPIPRSEDAESAKKRRQAARDRADKAYEEKKYGKDGQYDPSSSPESRTPEEIQKRSLRPDSPPILTKEEGDRQDRDRFMEQYFPEGVDPKTGKIRDVSPTTINGQRVFGEFVPEKGERLKELQDKMDTRNQMTGSEIEAAKKKTKEKQRKRNLDRGLDHLGDRRRSRDKSMAASKKRRADRRFDDREDMSDRNERNREGRLDAFISPEKREAREERRDNAFLDLAGREKKAQDRRDRISKNRQAAANKKRGRQQFRNDRRNKARRMQHGNAGFYSVPPEDVSETPAAAAAAAEAVAAPEVTAAPLSESRQKTVDDFGTAAAPTPTPAAPADTKAQADTKRALHPDDPEGTGMSPGMRRHIQRAGADPTSQVGGASPASQADASTEDRIIEISQRFEQKLYEQSLVIQKLQNEVQNLKAKKEAQQPPAPPPPTPGSPQTMTSEQRTAELNRLNEEQRRRSQGGTTGGAAGTQRYRAAGGSIPSSSDTVPAMLTPGEFVMTKEAVQSHGVGYMKQLNKGHIPGFRRGGVVGTGGVQYKQEGGQIGGGGGIALDTSNLSDILANFNTNLTSGLENIVTQFTGFSESFTRLSESFSNLTMAHTFTGDMTLAFNITNADAIKNAVADAITPRITEIITKELDVRLNKDFQAG